MADLEAQLEGRAGARLPADRHRRRVLDGRRHRQAATRSATWPSSYDALVMVDDSHAVGFMGETGRGTPELCGVMDRVDIITGTLGKALGGAAAATRAAAQRDRRAAAPALAAVPVLQHAGAADRRPRR